MLLSSDKSMIQKIQPKVSNTQYILFPKGHSKAEKNCSLTSHVMSLTTMVAA